MSNPIERRQFLSQTSLSALHLFVLGCSRSDDGHSMSVNLPPEKTGKPKSTVPASRGLGAFIDSKLPVVTVGDFKYVVVQQGGATLSDGHVLGAQPDGMACFQDEQGRYVLLRNQELGARRFLKKYGLNDQLFKGGNHPPERYRDDMFGGVTRVVLDPVKLAKDFEGESGQASSAVVESHYVLAGTDRNCAGGQFEQHWITCEESSEPGHGYAFITNRDDTALTPPRRVDSWGRLHREAVSVHKATGITYMTEDRKDGCFYRFVPTKNTDPFGAGELQALRIDGVKTTDPYPKSSPEGVGTSAFKPNQSWRVSWVRVDDPQAEQRSCREQAHAKGGTIFNRCEGITQDESGIWFAASLGGPVQGGQIFHLTHANGKVDQVLTLKHEVLDRRQLSCPDNLTVAPWGDLVMAEDNYSRTAAFNTQFVRCMDKTGGIYPLLKMNEALARLSGQDQNSRAPVFLPMGNISL